MPMSLYQRIRRGVIKVDRNSPLLYRFWKHVNKSGPIHPIYGQCWIWEKAPSWYGVIRINWKLIYVHRYSWEIHKGPIPAGIGVCHHCDVPSCVNPKHLFLGDQKSNMKDCSNKKRMGKCHGERHQWAKLNEAVVREMRRRFDNRKLPKGDPVDGIAALAREFNISGPVACQVVYRKAWTHVI